MASLAPMIQRLLPPILAAVVLLSPGALCAQGTAEPAPAAGPALSATAAAAPANALPAATPAPAQSASIPPAPSSDLGGSLLQLGFGFVVVMALLFGCLWLLKRLQSPLGRSGGLMKVVASLPLGARERAVVLQVGDQWLVVGMGPSYMVKLAEMPPQALPAAPAGPSAPDFSAWLKRALDHRKGGNPDA